MGKYRVIVDLQKCIGAATCVEIAPEVFELGEDAKARVKDPEGADEDTLFEAAEECPTKAILLIDQESGRQVYPD